MYSSTCSLPSSVSSRDLKDQRHAANKSRPLKQQNQNSTVNSRCNEAAPHPHPHPLHHHHHLDTQQRWIESRQKFLAWFESKRKEEAIKRRLAAKQLLYEKKLAELDDHSNVVKTLNLKQWLSNKEKEKQSKSKFQFFFFLSNQKKQQQLKNLIFCSQPRSVWSWRG